MASHVGPMAVIFSSTFTATCVRAAPHYAAATVEAGWAHTVALKQDATVWTVGSNDYGALGDNTTSQKSTFAQVFSSGQSIAAGGWVTGVVASNDNLWVTGYGEEGQLGLDNDWGDVSVLTEVMSGVRAFDNSWFYHSALVKIDGTVWGTGYNDNGQLGLGHDSPSDGGYEQFWSGPALTGAQGVACGKYFTVVLKADNTVWTSGDNSDGALGDNGTSDRFTFAQVMADAQAIAASSEATAVLQTDGTVWTAGRAEFGRLGDGDTSDSTRPYFAQVMADAQAVSLGEDHLAVLKSDGSVWSAGRNQFGQLGDNSSSDRSTFTVVLTGVQAVSCGGYHTAVLRDDHTLWTVGRNDHSQLGDNTTEDRSTFQQVLDLGLDTPESTTAAPSPAPTAAPTPAAPLEFGETADARLRNAPACAALVLAAGAALA